MNLLSKDPVLSRLSLRNPLHFLALGFGSGLAAKAPGTFGTLAAIPVYLLMTALSFPQYLLCVALFAVVGIYICDKAAKDLQVHDHGAIVWDEIVGLLITLIAAPAGVVWLLLGFVLFRFFDIIKPWPISWLDKQLHGGLGIMLDDVLAGILALFCLQVIAFNFA